MSTRTDTLFPYRTLFRAGRVLDAVQLEVEEAALTGESVPATKAPAAVADVDAPVADRTSMVHMQTTVTRGRGELVVTATGMGTEIGRIAGLLREDRKSTRLNSSH